MKQFSCTNVQDLKERLQEYTKGKVNHMLRKRQAAIDADDDSSCALCGNECDVEADRPAKHKRHQKDANGRHWKQPAGKLAERYKKMPKTLCCGCYRLFTRAKEQSSKPQRALDAALRAANSVEDLTSALEEYRAHPGRAGRPKGS